MNKYFIKCEWKEIEWIHVIQSREKTTWEEKKSNFQISKGLLQRVKEQFILHISAGQCKKREVLNWSKAYSFLEIMNIF